ncbi:MAG TPA: flippase-like domain-containing protein, partial [Methanoculleus sp.]|nr:flippase-like domain-containing protein [Methanoculleus sp.]HUM77512.1 flippase-like domain-containing protein [Methanoculleus sp.]
MNGSQVKWLLVSIGFSVLVLGVVLYFTVDETTVDYIRRINPFYLLAAVVLHLLSLVFWSLRIQKMSESLGFRVRFTHCMNLVLANMLVAAVTPSQAGGEPVRIHELYRAGVPVGDATAV